MIEEEKIIIKVPPNTDTEDVWLLAEDVKKDFVEVMKEYLEGGTDFLDMHLPWHVIFEEEE